MKSEFQALTLRHMNGPAITTQNQVVERVPETIPPSQAKSPPAGPLTALRTYNTPIPRIKDALMRY